MNKLFNIYPYLKLTRPEIISFMFFKVTILLELRYRSPLEGNEDSDDGLDDEDDEEFIPNVGLVSLTLN